MHKERRVIMVLLLLYYDSKWFTNCFTLSLKNLFKELHEKKSFQKVLIFNQGKLFLKWTIYWYLVMTFIYVNCNLLSIYSRISKLWKLNSVYSPEKLLIFHSAFICLRIFIFNININPHSWYKLEILFRKLFYFIYSSVTFK